MCQPAGEGGLKGGAKAGEWGDSNEASKASRKPAGEANLNVK